MVNLAKSNNWPWKNTMRRILNFLAAILVGVNVSGQTHYIEFPTNQFRVEENNYYCYNYTIHSFPYGAPTRLDTLNICRVRRNKIKSVTIYQFYSATDSLEISKTEYDSLGLTSYMKTLFSDKDVKCMNCDSVFPLKNIPCKTTRKRSFHLKEKWITDSAGYTIEYQRINKGLLNRWIMNNIGIPDKKITYSYDSLYLSVTETDCFSEKGHFKDCASCTYYRYEYRLDSKGDLLSESWYEKNENGIMEYTSGYTYHYEYY